MYEQIMPDRMFAFIMIRVANKYSHFKRINIWNLETQAVNVV